MTVDVVTETMSGGAFGPGTGRSTDDISGVIINK